MADLLNLFRSDLGRVKASLRKTIESLELAKRRRDELLALALPPSDLCEIACKVMADRAKDFPRRLKSKMDFAIRKGNAINAAFSGFQRFPFLAVGEGGNVPTVADLEAFLYYMFPDAIKAGLLRAYEDMGYRCGPPQAERTAELKTLEVRIAELEADRAKLTAQIEDVRRELD